MQEFRMQGCGNDGMQKGNFITPFLFILCDSVTFFFYQKNE
jgi:hypothetical protein